MDDLFSWLASHEALVCVALALAISEALPFLKGRAAPFNGIAQSLIALLLERAQGKAAPKGEP